MQQQNQAATLFERHGNGLSHALVICFLSMFWGSGCARFFVPLLQLWHKEDAEDQESEWLVKMAGKFLKRLETLRKDSL